MSMKTPAFWYRRRGALALLLLPLSWLYCLVRCLVCKQAVPYESKIPVICVGNLVAGGSGKTPAAIALMEMLGGKGAFISRGYGGTRKQAGFVDAATETAKDVGDEPLLLARTAPVVVSANRAEGAQLAEASGIPFLIMDDGLQNSRLAKDVSFAVIDGTVGFGNRLQLPAGPLRTSLKEGFAKADAFILIGDDQTGALNLLPAGKPVFRARLKADISKLNMNQTYIAFCGLGRPEKFRRTLEENKIKLCGWHAFADHHPYSKGDMDRLATEAGKNGARLITTEKDAVRLPAHTNIIDVLPVKLEWQDAGALQNFLRDRIRK